MEIKNFLSIFKKFFNLILKLINSFNFSNSEINFIRHNKNLFHKSKIKKNVILVEMIKLQSNHIAISYLSKALSEIHEANIIGYQPRFPMRILDKIKFYIGNYKTNFFFKSFGMIATLVFKINPKTYKSAYHLMDNLISKINSKSDLESLEIDGVLFGDLIYDQYLRSYMKPTVDLQSKEFKKIFLEFCLLYQHWLKTFEENNVKSLIISHACYFFGIPSRIAISLGIPVYQTTIENIYYLSKHNPYPSSEFHFYKNAFSKLDNKTQINAIKQAQERLKLIFEGSVNVDQMYIKNSAFHKKKSHKRLLKNRNPIKILIATHCFFDSPHGLGKSLFSDFYEWLEFLLELSNLTDYEWYIKTHPNTFPENKKIIASLLKKYSNVNYLNDDVSHNQLIEEGINVVLTIYGSIGLEYAAKNITVINASQNNPRISFDFNIHPKSKEELKNIILNLKKYINHNIILEDVYKCYYMKYLNYKQDIFIKDFKTEINKIGGYYNSLFTPKIYDFWIKYWSTDIHSQINNSLKKFLLSGEYKMKSNWN